jgi:hypothetical protein
LGARISGTVRDLAGHPVADARVATSDVTAVDLNYREALTDSDGSFTLTGVTTGNWSLAATKSGWAFAPTSFANPLPVTGDASNANFVGQPVGWRVTGLVRYLDGNPVAGALVSDGTRTEPTGRDGSFAFVGVPLGTYTLQVSAPGAQFTPVKLQVAYRDIIVPTITEISNLPSSSGVRPGNTPPEFIQAARAVGALNVPFVQLDAFASDDDGATKLTYAWSVAGSAPGPVLFLRNGACAAAATVAQFSMPGVYQLRVTATDAEGASTSSDVTLTIRSFDEPADPPIAAWRRAHFSGEALADPTMETSLWGLDADPDGDGTINLLEYAFDLDPLTPDIAGLPRPAFVTINGVEYLAITFRRNPAADDVVFTPQASSDLQTWSTGMIPVGANGAEVSYRDFAPAATFDKRFVRVEVSLP